MTARCLRLAWVALIHIDGKPTQELRNGSAHGISSVRKEPGVPSAWVPRSAKRRGGVGIRKYRRGDWNAQRPPTGRQREAPAIPVPMRDCNREVTDWKPERPLSILALGSRARVRRSKR